MAKDCNFEFDAEKNRRLQRERGISFDQMIALMEAGRIVDVRVHHNIKKYPNQHAIEIDGGDYIYLVPCVIAETVFLKTIYPSRKATKMRKGEM